MKLPVPGFVSNALSSLINNDRRRKHVPFGKGATVDSKPTGYNLPKVSKAERKKVVDSILRKRRGQKVFLWSMLSIISLGVIYRVVLLIRM